MVGGDGGACGGEEVGPVEPGVLEIGGQAGYLGGECGDVAECVFEVPPDFGQRRHFGGESGDDVTCGVVPVRDLL